MAISELWRPTASLAQLQKRAQMLQQIRTFFIERGLLEVETPLLSHASVTDIHLHSLCTQVRLRDALPSTLYLQTSPEYAMKRLLASGSGSIFQLCKAFRDDEAGRLHNPEFTMLEWYRVGFDHHQLMGEMDEFLQAMLEVPSAVRYTYAAVFEQYLQVNPHVASLDDLQAVAYEHAPELPSSMQGDRDTVLQYLMSEIIEPALADLPAPVFIYDYPTSQAALAKLVEGEDGQPVAARFEVYWRGVELANGFYELTDAEEQAARFQADLQKREAMGLAAVPVDQHLLAALQHGLPDCAGVALGVDRLLMLAMGASQLSEAIAFSVG